MLKSYISQELSTFDYKMFKVIDHIQKLKIGRFFKMTLKSKKNNANENGIIPAHKLEDKHIDAAEKELAVGNSEIRIS